MALTDTLAEPGADVPPPSGSGPAPRRRVSGRGPVLVAGAATVLATVLGRYHLGANSLWYDEAFTVGLVDRPVGDALWRITHWELNQSPYYLGMLAWQRLGDSELFLRLPSAGFAVLTVPLVYALGRRLADPWVGAIAAATVAGHALVVQWSQQLRGYTLATFLVCASTLLLVRALDRPSTGRSVAYGVIAAVTAYTHLVAGLVIGAHALSLLLLRPRPWRFARVAGPLAGALVLPLAWFVLTRQGDPLAWVDQPDGNELRRTAALVAGGDTANLWLVGVLGMAGTVVALADARRAATSTERWRLAVPVLWLLVPVAVVLGSTYTVKPLLVDRFLIVVVPALALLVATAVRRLPRPAGIVAAGALAVVSAQGVADWYDTGNFEDWRGAVSSVEAAVEPGDAVITWPAQAVHAVRYYGPSLPIVSPAGFAGIDGDRLWLLDRQSLGGTERPVPAGFDAWLRANYRLDDTTPFENVDVLLYERRTP